MMRYHTLSWLAWLTMILLIVSATRNPLYLLLVLLIIQITSGWLRLQSGRSESAAIPLRFSLILILGAALFNALTSHFGDTVLLEIPGKIPLLSGAVTLEGILYGAINGLILACMLGAFTVVNQALSVRELIGMIPQAYHAVAVIAAIGMTFLPVTIQQFEQIREAQAIRGHRLRGLRDWLPLVLPLLTSGLERAMHLAEAMTARGFASQADGQEHASARWALLLGLGLLVAGWIVHLGSVQPGIGGGLLALGAGCILGALWVVGRKSRRTSYQKQSWRAADGFVILGALVPLFAFVLAPSEAARSILQYNPYPTASLPGLELWGMGSLLGLLLPTAAGAVREK